MTHRSISDVDVLNVAREMLREFGNETPNIVIFGDGSGTTIGNPFAWACFIVDMTSEAVYRITGGGNCGTSNYAELSPYVHAIWFITSTKTLNERGRIGIISDSELTVKCGKLEYERRANRHLWAAIEHFEKNGLEILWHHIRRNTNIVSSACDSIAGELRKLFKGHEDGGVANAQNRPKTPTC